MSTGRSDELRRRAAVHAALADPGRLAIVDLLVDRDASPSAIGAHLAMPSNLLAHHLDVLQRAGVIRRWRSEGDRRRTYIGIADGGVDASAQKVQHAARVVFVCTQNSARSQLASALWRRRSRIPATSAGTDPATHVHPGALAAARRHGLSVRARRPRRVDQVLTPDDLVITVCDRAHEELSLTATSLHWSVPDPARVGTDTAFDDTVAELGDRVSRIAPVLRKGSSS